MFAKLILRPDSAHVNPPTGLLPLMSADAWSGGQFVAPQLTSGQVIDLLICLDKLGFLDLNSELDLLIDP